MKKTNDTSLVILGVLPFAAATSKVYYAFWTALVLTAVVVTASLVAGAVKHLIRGRAGLLVHAAVGAGLTAVSGMLLQAYVPEAAAGIGVYLSFMAVNVLVFAVSEASAENILKASVKNAAVCAGMGSGVLLLAAVVRELLRYGTLFAGFGGGEGAVIFGDWFTGVEFAGTAAGTLILFGLAAAAVQKIVGTIRAKQRKRMILHEMIASDCHPDLVIDAITGKTVRRSTAAMLAQRRLTNEANAENDADENEADAELEALQEDAGCADAENDTAGEESGKANAENKSGEVEAE